MGNTVPVFRVGISIKLDLSDHQGPDSSSRKKGTYKSNTVPGANRAVNINSLPVLRNGLLFTKSQ